MHRERLRRGKVVEELLIFQRFIQNYGEYLFLLGVILLTWFITWISTAFVQHRRIIKYFPEESREQIESRDKKIKELQKQVKDLTAERDRAQLQLRGVRGALDL